MNKLIATLVAGFIATSAFAAEEKAAPAAPATPAVAATPAEKAPIMKAKQKHHHKAKKVAAPAAEIK